MGSFWDRAGGLLAVGDGPPRELSPTCSRALTQRERVEAREGWAAFQHCVSTPGTDFPCPGPCLPYLCLTQWFFPSFLPGQSCL